MTDGDGNVHAALTQIGHIVRKATGGKLRTLRDELAANPAVTLVDYTEDAAPADYDAYATALGAHRGEEIEYRALHASGPREILEPLTKSLSRL